MKSISVFDIDRDPIPMIEKTFCTGDIFKALITNLD